MGQIGFIFCAALAFWVVKDGVEEIGLLTEAVVPIVTETGPSFLEAKAEVLQTLLLELLPIDLL